MLNEVLAGLDAASAAGFAPIKINMVVMRDNADEIDAMVDFCMTRDYVPRLIEPMPMGDTARKMGTAEAGPDQGQVRFRITINPDGSLAQAEELWPTSAKVSELARKAILAMPLLLTTPTGKPLVFEQTISFLPYETGWPPSYKNDCLPDPPTFRSPFACDGRGQPNPPAAEAPSMEAAAQAECDPTSTAESIEEEEGELKRQMERNRWGR